MKTYLVIATRGHKLDANASRPLSAPGELIGVPGSRRRQ
jgi:hypothetical protein